MPHHKDVTREIATRLLLWSLLVIWVVFATAFYGATLKAALWIGKAAWNALIS